MRKSINVETVFGTLTKEVLAKGWKARIGDWLSFLSSSAFGSEQWKMYETAIKADIEFAKANIELLSEEDYKWLLGYTSGLTLVSTDTEIMGKPKSSNGESSESQSTRWIVQITIGKDIYYRTLRTKNRMSPSIYDAKCYVSENAAKQAANSATIENRLFTLATVNSGNIAESCVVDVKEVLCTETSSRTIEIVKKPKKSMDIDSPEFKKALAEAPFVCKTHCESEEEDNLPDSPENHPAYTVPSKISALTDEFNKLPPYDSLASSTVKGAINKSKLTIAATESQKKFWVVQITKGKKVWYKTSGSFKDGYVSSSINDAALYYTKPDAAYFATFIKPGNNNNIYKLPFPVKVTVKEVVYTENASRTVELVKPVDSTVKKVRKPKVKEEWVLYINGINGILRYHTGEINIPSYYWTTDLKDAVKFPSYGAATKAKCKLIKAGFITLDVANVEDCK